MQEGRYCPGEEGKCVKFYVKENPKGGVYFTLRHQFVILYHYLNTMTLMIRVISLM